MKVATLGDLHCRVDTPRLVDDLLGEAIRQADVLVLAGDLTDTGSPQEALALMRQLRQVPIPIMAILGNHDHESDCAPEITKILMDGGIHLLNCSYFQVDDVAFVGTKGFCGGFGPNLVQPFGELALKTFIRSSIDETEHFGHVLAGLETRKRMAILHYAPIKETLAGEPPEIFPFLGTSRLADTIDRYGAELIIHGHAHHGYPHGHTQGRIPVHNVCRFVLERYTGQPYCMFDL